MKKEVDKLREDMYEEVDMSTLSQDQQLVGSLVIALILLQLQLLPTQLQSTPSST